MNLYFSLFKLDILSGGCRCENGYVRGADGECVLQKVYRDGNRLG